MAYKKAYSDINQAFREPIANGELTLRTSGAQRNAVVEEYNILKKQMKSVHSCESTNFKECWVANDVLWGGYPAGNQKSKGFIDPTGRAWASFSEWENLYLVDVNGPKKPNVFGRDRFIFTLVDKAGSRADKAANYVSVGIPWGDCYQSNGWCSHKKGHCYYKSWLK